MLRNRLVGHLSDDEVNDSIVVALWRSSFPFGAFRDAFVEGNDFVAVRSEFSAASLHIAYPSQTQSALLEGIALGLEFLGGVFVRMRFDNLTQAVARVVRGERRIEQDRFIGTSIVIVSGGTWRLLR